MLARTLAAMTVAWPLLLGAGWWARAHDGPPAVSAVLYLAAGRICHQRPERSFETADVQWPVCGRCAGLYLAAPLGAVIALARRRTPGRRSALVLLSAAAAPTAATLVLEWAGVPMSSLARFLAAAPLGAAIAAVIVTAAGRNSLR